ncbi:MAG: serine/threonine protein kinase [Planctomycetes bacterium]|nr:serine/threonine protein kinase [Planctomycetota bacterium]
MNAELHRRAKELFLDACDLPLEERAGFLAQRCGEDAELRAAVERLLAHDGAPSAIAERVVHEQLAALLDEERARALPAEIDRYRVLGLLGEGGFGAVYEAEQLEPVRRVVALKVLKPGMDSRQVLARFAAERQTLALMSHPCIATVLDAGITAEGRPFFAMERVQGVPLGRYCDEQQLDLAARLQLFLRICGAVLHAHQKGIVHRDLKPSNLLVATVDGSPLPKVIDFGIAKALQPLELDADITRERGLFLGTPEYVSPEQAAGELDIDTRSDIYSLGAVLYELLAGTTPLERETTRQLGLPALLQRIQSEVPPRPSLRIAEGSERVQAIARARRTDPQSLARALRGDLDWIALKALAKERAERYPTVSALAEDLERYRRGEPVLARAPSFAYRGARFARRNRAALLAAAAMLLLLIGGIVGTSLGLVRALRSQGEAEEARRRAEAFSEILLSALASGDPLEGGSVDRRVSEVMQRVVEDLDAGALRQHPESEAEVQMRVARTLLGNDHPAEGLQLAERSLAFYDAAGPTHAVDAARARMLVAIHLDRLGRTSEAEPLFRAVLDARRAQQPGDHSELAYALRGLGVVLQHRGRLDEAEAHYREALAMERRLHPEDHVEIASALNNLGSLLQTKGRSAEAEASFREALEMRRRLRPGGDPLTARALANLAQSLLAQRRPAEAEPLAQEALEMFRRTLPTDHADLAIGWTSVAFAHQACSRAAEAEAALREALALYRRNATGDHHQVAGALANLADLLLGLRRDGDAEALLGEALAMLERLFPEGHPLAVRCGANRAVALLRTSRPEEALEAAQRAAELGRAILEPTSSLRAQTEKILQQIQSGR